jgi:L-fuconolactonase
VRSQRQKARELKEANELIKQVSPNLPIVIDHIAKPDIKSGEFVTWQTNIKKLALHQNVFCKISGMVTEAEWKTWKPTDFKVYLDTVVKAFGTERLMYGSDWPVCLVAGDYAQVKGIIETYTEDFSDSEKNKVFGENATKFYSIV